MFPYQKIKLFYSSIYFSILHSMTFDLISGLHMQIQTWHPPLRLCTHAKYYVKSGLTNVLKNANKTKNKHLFSIRIANLYASKQCINNYQILFWPIIAEKMTFEAKKSINLISNSGCPILHAFKIYKQYS